MEYLDITCVAAIVVICYLAGLCIKALNLEAKWIPVVVGVVGGALGVVGFYIIPEYPADDMLMAIAVGIASGLASTGVHQVYKQLKGG